MSFFGNLFNCINQFTKFVSLIKIIELVLNFQRNKKL